MHSLLMNIECVDCDSDLLGVSVDVDQCYNVLVDGTLDILIKSFEVVRHGDVRDFQAVK